MALIAVDGLYKDGKVELTTPPADIQEARVVIVFLPATVPAPPPNLQSERDIAWERLLARMRKGFHLGGDPPYRRREELYEHLESGG